MKFPSTKCDKGTFNYFTLVSLWTDKRWCNRRSARTEESPKP